MASAEIVRAAAQMWWYGNERDMEVFVADGLSDGPFFGIQLAGGLYWPAHARKRAWHYSAFSSFAHRSG